MAEYTVGPRQKRRRVAKEVSLAMESWFDQVQPETTTNALTAQTLVDDKFNAPAQAAADFQAHLSSDDEDGENVSDLQSETNFNYEEFWAGYESLAEPDDDLDDDSVYGSCFEEENNDFFSDGETLPEPEPLSPSFKEKLASWVVKNQVPQCHVDQLLVILKSIPPSTSFDDLPTTCRTLLDTPRKTPIVEITSGHYYHFGLANGIKNVLRKLQTVSLFGLTLQLILNVVGLPIAKSSGSQLWPILVKIRNFSNSKPLIIGLFHGYEKPGNVNEYLSALVEELLNLYSNGLEWAGQIVNVELFCFLCDAPAKACVTCTKLHTGYFSCSKCCVEGDWHGRVVFLEEKELLRDNDSFRQQTQAEHHTGRSILERLPIDMVACFSLDYMHLVCLGIMRKLL